MRVLHDALRAGRPEVPAAELLKAAGMGKGDKARDLFRDCEAFGVVVIRCGPSSYRLALWDDDETTSDA